MRAIFCTASSAPISSSLRPAEPASARCLSPAGQDHRGLHCRPKRPRTTAAAFCSTLRRALAKPLVTKLNLYRLRSRVTVEDLSGSLGVMAAWDGTGTTRTGLAYADPRLPALGPARDPAAGPHRRCGSRTRRRSGRRGRIRNAPHRARHSARRRGFQLRRRVSARGRHGSARRRGFHQRLLRRPGGGVAHGASRHRAHPHGAGALRRRGAAGRRACDGRRPPGRQHGFGVGRARTGAVAARPGRRSAVARRAVSSPAMCRSD